jgi:hypothetical protein
LSLFLISHIGIFIAPASRNSRRKMTLGRLLFQHQTTTSFNIKFSPLAD